MTYNLQLIGEYFEWVGPMVAEWGDAEGTMAQRDAFLDMLTRFGVHSDDQPALVGTATGIIGVLAVLQEAIEQRVGDPTTLEGITGNVASLLTTLRPFVAT